LGVAIVGSVFASLYGPPLLSKLSELGVDEATAQAASESMGAALVVAGQAPADLGAQIIVAAQDAFIVGFSRGSLVAAGATILGAVVAAVFPPARARALASDNSVTVAAGPTKG
jgi:DHA2 family multidrug resistance protein-like MFS transporter